MSEKKFLVLSFWDKLKKYPCAIATQVNEFSDEKEAQKDFEEKKGLFLGYSSAVVYFVEIKETWKNEKNEEKKRID